MAKLELYEYPHPILKEKSKPVEKVDDELRAFLDDMLETMYEENGVGLAAPQVGVSKRIVVIDVSNDEEGDPIFLINPKIVWKSEEMVCGDEGCLSLPEQRAEVDRFEKVKVKYLDYDGKEQEIAGEGILSVALQHEIDHLDGILYIDHLSRLKRQMLIKKLQKMRAEKEAEE